MKIHIKSKLCDKDMNNRKYIFSLLYSLRFSFFIRSVKRYNKCAMSVIITCEINFIKILEIKLLQQKFAALATGSPIVPRRCHWYCTFRKIRHI